MGMLTLTSRGSGFTSSPITLTNPTFSRIFIITVCWTFIKGFLLIYFNDHVTFKSIYVVYYIYWLVCIEPSLHFRAWENISPSSNAAASCCRLPKFPHTGHHLPQLTKISPYRPPLAAVSYPTETRTTQTPRQVYAASAAAFSTLLGAFLT